MSAQNLTMVQAINLALKEELGQDNKTVLIGEDVAHFGGMFRVTEGLLDQFGENRVIDTPISESGFIGMAMGMAMTGLRPIVELMFVDFSLVAMDQLLNQVAKLRYMSGSAANAPMVIRTQGGGYKGAASQHSQSLETMFLHVPGLKVVAPSSPQSAYSLLKAAIRDNDPVVFIEHKQLYGVAGPVETGAEVPDLGKAKVVRTGAHLTVVSYSYTLGQCLAVADELAKEGLELEVIDLQTLNPLDLGTVRESVQKTHRLLVAHESHARCGVGRDLIAQIVETSFDELDAPPQLCAALDVPIPFAKVLEDVVLPTNLTVEQAVRRALA